ncbi:hypothetical protein [Pseudobutyrivibrio ruminis]|uniref:hypothetical protein n=1 Tax=Pseudobutyrivibrio ruminis TaxID=46206 RepID=UPI00051B0E6E|nr:hypothetical protein [Pseudobutyrivibrio ruminis]
MLKNIFSDKKNTTIFAIAALTTLVSMIVYMLAQGLWFNKLSISCSMWNDEMFYYKQIEGMVDYGSPQGVFGYTESHAIRGTYGAWGPVILMPFVIFGKVFGWNLASPIIFNALIMTIAFICYYFLLKPTIEQQIFTSLIFISYGISTRYIFSGTPEIMVTALGLIYCLLVYKVIKEEDSIGMRIASYVIIAYLTSAKGFFASLSLLMMVALLKRRKYVELIIQVIIILTTMFAFLYISKYYAAPYFFTLIDMEALKNPSAVIDLFKSSAEESFGYMKEALLLRSSMRGSWYLLFFVLGILLIKDLITKRNLYRLAAVIVWLSLIVAMWVLYDATEGCRHLMNFTIIGFLMVAHDYKSKIIKVAIIAVALYCCWLTTDTYYTGLPEKDEALYNAIQDQSLEEVMPITDDEWDNTVVWTLTSSFNELYALPSGFGISCCFEDYPLYYIQNVQSKYVTTCIDGDVDKLLSAYGCQVVAEYGQIKIYKIRE